MSILKLPAVSRGPPTRRFSVGKRDGHQGLVYGRFLVLSVADYWYATAPLAPQLETVACTYCLGVVIIHFTCHTYLPQCYRKPATWCYCILWTAAHAAILAIFAISFLGRAFVRTQLLSIVQEPQLVSLSPPPEAFLRRTNGIAA